MFDLTGKTALITGSSRGIGLAAAKAFSANGAKVLLHCAKPEKYAEEAQTLLPDSPFYYADLSSPNGAENLAEQIAGDGFSPDILILNASIQIRKISEKIDYADYEKQMTTNFYSSLRLMELFLNAMKSRRWGRIVTVGSIQQIQPLAEMAVYSASKCAQWNLMRNQAKILAPYGITVNNIAPGAILTPRNEQVLSDPDYEKECRRSIPAGYIGQAKDCTGAFLLFCSEAGKYITGVNLYVDGGKHLA